MKTLALFEAYCLARTRAAVAYERLHTYGCQTAETRAMHAREHRRRLRLYVALKAKIRERLKESRINMETLEALHRLTNP